MQIRRFLIILLISAISCSEWREIKIATVNKHGMFHERIQKALVSALKWVENAVQVQESQAIYPTKYVKKFVKGYDSSDIGTVTIQTPNKVFSVAFDSDDFDKVFKSADVVVFITPLTCKGTPVANGGQVELGKEYAVNIHKLGLLRYCYSEYQPQFNYYDLFRHELLHVLGYGILAKEDLPRRDAEDYQWKYEDGSEELATRSYFQTEDSATDEVRKHFNCHDLAGVESHEDGLHLNEYIFFVSKEKKDMN
uniref:Leishmanolysin-like peptidase n=1 Tax=Caenorhabditis tropicalis TaxID=1561998 RepID=A0A1I7TDC1_9PELO